MKIWLDSYDTIDIVVFHTYEDYHAAVERQRRLIQSQRRRSALMSDWDDVSDEA